MANNFFKYVYTTVFCSSSRISQLYLPDGAITLSCPTLNKSPHLKQSVRRHAVFLFAEPRGERVGLESDLLHNVQKEAKEDAGSQ